MFLVVMGYDDKTVQENLFTRWFSAGLGFIVLSLGEYEVLNTTLVGSDGLCYVLNRGGTRWSSPVPLPGLYFDSFSYPVAPIV